MKNSLANLRLAYLMANLCKSAYLLPEEKPNLFEKRLRHNLLNLGFTIVGLFEDSGIQGFVAINDQLYIEVFRGSDEVIDWVRNVSCCQVSTSLGLVHKGFNNGLDAVWPLIEAHRGTYRQGRKHYITGHSLGGALATLNYARCFEGNLIADGLFTFGAPMVGDNTYAEAFDQIFQDRIFRYVNKIDLVPSLPLPSLRIRGRTLKYKQVGGYLYLDGVGISEEKYNYYIQIFRFVIEWIAELFNSFKERRSGKVPRKWLIDMVPRVLNRRISDHQMDSYIASIESCIRDLDSHAKNHLLVDQDRNFPSP